MSIIAQVVLCYCVIPATVIAGAIALALHLPEREPPPPYSSMGE